MYTEERERHVYLTRTAEQAERYDGIFTFFLTLLFASNNLRIFSFAASCTSIFYEDFLGLFHQTRIWSIVVALLDATVAAFYGTGSKDELNRTAANHVLRDLQNNPDMWLQVVHILSNTQSLNTKFFSLQLPVEQRDGMKNYISDVIVKLSSNEISFRQERLYVNKLNIILVQILKHEWPARWRSFIPDLVAAAKTSETICENCMAILKHLKGVFHDSLSVFIQADLLFTYGYVKNLKDLKTHISKLCQCLLMSATSSSDDVESMKKLYLHNPYILTLREVGDGKDETVPKNVQQFSIQIIQCSNRDKLLYTLAILKLDLVQKIVLSRYFHFPHK
ncbi:hypothetical protein LXL04_026616 [Taraxacum kok-saghyz]